MLNMVHHTHVNITLTIRINIPYDQPTHTHAWPLYAWRPPGDASYWRYTHTHTTLRGPPSFLDTFSRRQRQKARQKQMHCCMCLHRRLFSVYESTHMAENMSKPESMMLSENAHERIRESTGRRPSGYAEHCLPLRLSRHVTVVRLPRRQFQTSNLQQQSPEPSGLQIPHQHKETQQTSPK